MNTSNEEILKLYNDIVENKENNTIFNENVNSIFKYAIENKNEEISKECICNFHNDLSTYSNFNKLEFSFVVLKKIIVQHNIDFNLENVPSWKLFRDNFKNKLLFL